MLWLILGAVALGAVAVHAAWVCRRRGGVTNGPPPKRRRGAELSRPTCGHEATVPMAFKRDGETRWWLELRCGACDDVRELAVPHTAVEQHEMQLDQGTAHLAAVLAELERDQMAVEAELFCAALRAGLVTADDFSR